MSFCLPAQWDMQFDREPREESRADSRGRLVNGAWARAQLVGSQAREILLLKVAFGVSVL